MRRRTRSGRITSIQSMTSKVPPLRAKNKTPRCIKNDKGYKSGKHEVVHAIEVSWA